MVAVFDEEHARIVYGSHVGNDGQFAIRQPYGQGIDGQRVAEHLGEWLFVVVGLEAETVALATAVVVDIRNKGLIVAGKVELSFLVGNHP